MRRLVLLCLVAAISMAASGCGIPLPGLRGSSTAPSHDTVIVPDLVGLTQSGATAQLAEAGLRLGDVTFAIDEATPIGEVVQQEPAPGTIVSKGSSVAVVVSHGAETVEVPSVVGLHPDEAAAVLDEAGFKMKENSIHGPVDPDAGKASIGQVYRQTPTAGSNAPKGTTVVVRTWWESQ